MFDPRSEIANHAFLFVFTILWSFGTLLSGTENRFRDKSQKQHVFESREPWIDSRSQNGCKLDFQMDPQKRECRAQGGLGQFPRVLFSYFVGTGPVRS